MTKKNEVEETIEEVDDYDQKLKFINKIANPLANKKLTKRLFKCVKKASAHKTFLRQGLKEVQKHIRRGEKGLVIFAGDVSPVDTYSHMPIVCEEAKIPYCYVPSKLDLGHALGSKKSACVVMVKSKADYKDVYDKCVESVRELPTL
ncbi:unnamed protein product [Brachionus calyciflorus]|uniref:H/ACA ribonucleoprotein complex subunit 2 n=1 Tax=Brachionus calyciflorus TaxID=104777 RepID=A0A813VPF2_9BILA|nr:unnamed protein product [Brachionus calyciflorus]